MHSVGPASSIGLPSACRMFHPEVLATPEGIGGGIRPSCTAPDRAAPRVLNARRHRRGNQGPGPDLVVSALSGAQRPKASEGESGSWSGSGRLRSLWCSTPEGIGGGIRRACDRHRHHVGPVLNARRHRRGNQTCRDSSMARSSSAQRPKASEGESDLTLAWSVVWCGCAQRPKASEGESGLTSGV